MIKENVEKITCSECRDEILGTKYTLVRKRGVKPLYYHEKCMPPHVKSHVDLNTIRIPNNLLMPL